MENMRESIARSTDFASGIVKETKKLKPANSSAKGFHTVQLFDSNSGELVEQHESENFLSVALDDIQKLAAKMSFIAQYISFGSAYGSYMTNNSYGVKDDGSSLMTSSRNFEKLFGHQFNMSAGIITPFRYMVLTSDASPEEPTKERLWKGNVIGWAERETTYSGADAKQGSFNAAESFSENGHIKFVWDFPTHAANGTFQSLVWSADVWKNQLGVIPHGHFDLEAPEGYQFYYFEAMGSKIKGNTLYVALEKIEGEDWGIGKWTVDFANNTATFVSLTPITNMVNSTSYEMRDFAIDDRNGDIYIINDYGHIYKHSSEGGNSIPFTHTGTTAPMSAGVTTSSHYYGMDIHNGVIYYTSYHGKIYVDAKNIDDWSNYWETQKISEGPSMPTVLNVVDGAGLVVLDGSNRIAYVCSGFNANGLNMSSNDFAPIGEMAHSSYPYSEVQSFRLDEDGDIEHIHTTTDIYIGYQRMNKMRVYRTKLGRMGGRNLLPQPITKTNEYTMKVTYDLYFE